MGQYEFEALEYLEQNLLFWQIFASSKSTLEKIDIDYVPNQPKQSEVKMNIKEHLLEKKYACTGTDILIKFNPKETKQSWY